MSPRTERRYCSTIQCVKVPRISPALNKRLSDRLAELLPNVERVQITRASHHMHEEEPEAVNDAILGFLAKHAAAEEFVPPRLEASPSALR